MRTAKAGRTGVERYTCRGRGRRFVDRPGFEGLHYAEDTVPFALRQVTRGTSPGKAAETVPEENGVDPSSRTVQRRMDKYPKLVSAFSKCLEMRGGAAVSVDEKHYKPRGKSRWAAGAVRVKTRFIIASEHWPDKMNRDGAALILKILERPGAPPVMLISDGLKGRKTGCNAAPNAGPRPSTWRMPRSTAGTPTTTHTNVTMGRPKCSGSVRSGSTPAYRRCWCRGRRITTPSDRIWGWAGRSPPKRRAFACLDPTRCSP